MLSHTAQVLSARRALAFSQNSPLVNDHLAHHFVSGEYSDLAKKTDVPVHYVLMRHRKLEDFFLDQSSACKQVVILGSGFDTKLQRFPRLWEKYFEVEGDEMARYKSAKLKELGLSVPDFITPKGEPAEQFRTILTSTAPHLRTLFLAEGYFMYFGLDHILEFMRMAHDYYKVMPSFGFDMIDESYPDNPDNRNVLERIRASGENVLTWCEADVFKRLFKSFGMNIEIWHPSKLSSHYRQAKWEKADDKYVLIAY